MTLEEQRKAHQPILGLECLHCVLNQVIATTELAGMPEPRRRALMQRCVERMAQTGIDHNNSELIGEIYRMVLDELGDRDPYAKVKRDFNEGMLRLCPEVRRHIRSSADPLAAAVRASIAGNLIDIAALGLGVTMDAAMAKVREVDEAGLYVDDCAALKDALAGAKTLLVLGDNCGEIALDKLLIETILELYPGIRAQYGVRGAPVVNDVTREDAAQVGMEEVAEVIDNGDDLLTTLLYRTSPAFNAAFDAADVVIAKGMGNLEGLQFCDRENLFFLLIAKCDVVARIVRAPKGSILCMKQAREAPRP